MNNHRDLPTADILDRFGSDPQPYRKSHFVVKNGGMFESDPPPVEFYPRNRSFPKTSYRKGELLQAFESMDMGILTFFCYSDEEGCEGELHKIRVFRLSYHLTDDTISLYEPKVENSGCMQGRHFVHQKVPSEEKVGGPYIHWTHLNVGIDTKMFGKRYRITSCDAYTRRYLSEHGINVNPEEQIPEDPWLARRRRREKSPVIPDQKGWEPVPALITLRCCWIERANDYCRVPIRRIFKMLVFSADHTVSLVEETKEFEGQLFLRRTRLPYPKGPDGVQRFYRSWDLRPGMWVNVFSRPMFIFDCEGEETKKYLTQQYGEIDYRNCASSILEAGPPAVRFVSAPEEMAFISRMLDPPSIFYGVDFILTYNINKQTVDIVEAGRQRKWSKGRSFLVSVDASTLSENQFNVGNVVKFFKWGFMLMEPDQSTAEYLKWKSQQ